ncbi:MAG TPA: hypothetical protein VF294_00575, partial [Polyangiaceae bacterium]
NFLPKDEGTIGGAAGAIGVGAAGAIGVGAAGAIGVGAAGAATAGAATDSACGVASGVLWACAGSAARALVKAALTSGEILKVPAREAR